MKKNQAKSIQKIAKENTGKLRTMIRQIVPTLIQKKRMMAAYKSFSSYKDKKDPHDLEKILKINNSIFVIRLLTLENIQKSLIFLNSDGN